MRTFTSAAAAFSRTDLLMASWDKGPNRRAMGKHPSSSMRFHDKFRDCTVFNPWRCAGHEEGDKMVQQHNNHTKLKPHLPTELNATLDPNI